MMKIKMAKKLTCCIALALGIAINASAEAPAANGTGPVSAAVSQPAGGLPAAHENTQNVQGEAGEKVQGDVPQTAVEQLQSQLTQDQAAPVRSQSLMFGTAAPAPGSMVLRGVRNTGYLEFGVRSDEVVSDAELTLNYIPSPSLIPVESHIKIYLNDELMGVATITKEQLGQPGTLKIPLDSRYITDFNRLRLEFIGHYPALCENPANSTLWVDISKGTSLNLTYQRLPLKNDLSHFPEPFYDSRDNRKLTLPVVFASSPSLKEQQAAAIMASWFGVQSQWRGQSFPVSYNQLPKQHGVVFATNEHRPDFLKDYPPVNAPVVEMISHPANPYIKILLVMGRNDDDLIVAAKGIAQGNLQFRGQNITIDNIAHFAERQPYDAPNWVRTDRPTLFSELQQYQGQLQRSGGQIPPITLPLNLPPDLFLIRNTGIDMKLLYRYTAPLLQDQSRLSIFLNDQFMQAYPLKVSAKEGSQILHLPLVSNSIDSNEELTIPALKLGADNELRFDFSFGSIVGETVEGLCQTHLPVENHAVIDGNSSIDFSGYRHYIAMPDLRIFANAGFPFSRMADLSETEVLVAKQPSAGQVTTLLNAMGSISAHVGYPAVKVTLVDDWSQAKASDSDILIVGKISEQFRDDNKLNMLIEATRSWAKEPKVQRIMLPDSMLRDEDAVPDNRVDTTSDGAIAAVIGFQSPFNQQRSVVALLADSDRGYELLNDALSDSGKRGAIAGTLSVIRESGVSSRRVGDIYYVGYLPWWELLWHKLATHPFLVAALAALVVVLVAVMLWRGLRSWSRRRLSPDE